MALICTAGAEPRERSWRGCASNEQMRGDALVSVLTSRMLAC